MCCDFFFMSMIEVSKCNEAFLIIEQFDAIQHMHVNLFSYLDHSVFIHHALIYFSLWTRLSF